jgi:biofilm PGA synthesis N-glycosyltransferase PgaC
MLIYLILIFTVYFGFLLACMVGWQRFIRSAKSHGGAVIKFVSVVVAVRNEEDSIAPLLDTLRSQDFPNTSFEIIFVNDHSTDDTELILSGWIRDNPHIQAGYFHSTDKGKKQALTEGIHQAKGEIILTTDADCVLPSDWISRMVMSFNPDTTMVIGLVKIQQEKSFFSKLQALEFTSLMGSSMALFVLGFPIMCNGASLAFRKKSFIDVNGYQGNLHISSGDDEFLMRKFEKQFPGSAQSIRWPSVVVATQPQPSLMSFIYQRLRWAGKWRANDSVYTKILALFILVFQITSIIAMDLLFFGENPVVPGALLGLKFLMEGYFLYNVSKKLHQGFSIPAFVLLQFVYPVYVVIMGLLSQLLDYEWKGRKGQQ